MANLKVNVVDGNNINVEVTPVPKTVVTIDKGISGVGIESVSIVYNDPYYYLDFQYTNGTSELVQLPAIASGVVSFNTRIGVVTLEFTDVTEALGYTPPEPDGTGATGTWNISVSGNAATVTNGVYTTGTYSDPLWIAALTGSKIIGDISGNSSNVNGTVEIAHGGTGQVTANAAFNALAPSQGGHAGQYLKTDGTNASWDQLDISTADITGTLPVNHGGTGATNAADARTNLNAASQSTTVSAGTGLSGGGDLSMNRTLSISNTGVTAATKGSASKTVTATVNAQGQLTSLTDQDIAIANTQVSGLGTASTLNAGVANGVATLDSAGTVPLSQIPPSLIGALNYQGTWNASTNTPTLTSSVGTKGYYYVVSVAGNTNLNGITDWKVGDWAIFDGSSWGKIDNTDSVTSVNGYTGAVVLGYSDVGAPSTSGANATGTWNISVSGNAETVTNGVYTTDTGTVTNTMLAGSIANNKLANSTISGVALGSNLNALTIGSGLSGTSYNGSAGVTITNAAPDQVVSLTGAGTTSISGTYPNFTITSTSATGSVFGPGSSTDNAIVRFDGTTGTLIQNSAVTLDDAGNIINPDSVQFSGTVPATQPIGTLWFDSSTDTLNLQQNAITQQIGEELYVYGKASSAISGQTLLQAIYKTGTVGASGNITFAPTIAGLTDGGAIIGVATEDIAANGFGRITNFGVVHSINTSGSTYGETWADGDDIWYNPVTGGLTKTKPSAPNIKVQIGTVIHAGSGGSGSFQVLLNAGSSLGGTDNNVQITSPASGNALIYDATVGYWKNANLTDGTGINITEGAGSITIANTGVTSITGTASQITASASTGGVTLSLPSTINVDISGNAGTVTNGVYTTGSYSDPTWITSLAGSKISGNISGNAANVTGTVAIDNGGTGQTTANAAFNALAPSQTGNSGKYLTTDGTNTSWGTNPLGDVVGPASATDNAVARFDGTTGKLIQNSAVTIGDDGATVIAANSSSDGLRITQTGTGNALVVEDSANPDSSPFVITSNGSIVAGGLTGTYGVNFQNQNSYLETAFDSILGSYLHLRRAGNTLTSPAIVANGNTLGEFDFEGYDGSSYKVAASLTGQVDGTPGTNDMPGRLLFSTTADGASSPTERMRIDSYGSVGIGGAAGAAYTMYLLKNPTGATTTYGLRNGGTIQSDVTSQHNVFYSRPATAASAFTVSGLYHYRATQGTFGAGSVVTTQHGFVVDSDLTGATNNYGFLSNIAAGTGRYNFYAGGSADNYFAGSVGIGSVPSSNNKLTIKADRTVTPYGISLDSYNGVTFENSFVTQFTGAVLNIGNYQNFPLAFITNNTERMRIDNAGRVGIGTTPFGSAQFVLSGAAGFDVAQTTVYAARANTTMPSTGTSGQDGFSTTLIGNAASHTVTGVNHFHARSYTVGASQTVTNQYGFFASASLTGATNNFGFYSNIASGTGRWNFYANGSARNYFAGNVGIGTSPDVPLHILGAAYQDTTSNNEFAVVFGLRKSRSGAIVQNGDTLGEISYFGYDGTSYLKGASITSRVDGTPGTNDMPSSLIFSTTADGASTLTERMRIDNQGNLIQSAPNTAPTLSTNGTMVFNLTSNTNLRVSVRGSDGVTRTANITLA